MAQKYYQKQKIIYLSNYNSEHFGLCCRSMANPYQRNKQNFIYRNGCAKISKKIKDGKNKKWTYKGNHGSEREAGHHREEKTTMVWPCQKDPRGQNTKINYGMDTNGKKEKRTSKKNVDRRSTGSHDNKKFGNRSMEKQRGMAFGFWKMATAVIKPDR